MSEKIAFDDGVSPLTTTNNASKANPFPVQVGNLATVINTATTTLVKSGSCNLHTITINTKGTVASAVTVYDALTATGTPIAVIDSLNLSGSFTYDVNLLVGLTIVTTGTAAPNITVSYR